MPSRPCDPVCIVRFRGHFKGFRGRQLVQMPFLIDWARTPHVIGLVTLLPKRYSISYSNSRTVEVRNERGYEKVFPCKKILATVSKPPLNALI